MTAPREPHATQRILWDGRAKYLSGAVGGLALAVPINLVASSLGISWAWITLPALVVVAALALIARNRLRSLPPPQPHQPIATQGTAPRQPYPPTANWPPPGPGGQPGPYGPPNTQQRR